MARKVDEVANFVFVQLTEQEPGIYDKRHQHYAGRDKIDLVLEGISHKMNESGMWIQIQNMSARAMQTITTICPVLCYASQQLG
jgi:hypothetical protein